LSDRSETPTWTKTQISDFLFRYSEALGKQFIEQDLLPNDYSTDEPRGECFNAESAHSCSLKKAVENWGGSLSAPSATETSKLTTAPDPSSVALGSTASPSTMAFASFTVVNPLEERAALNGITPQEQSEVDLIRQDAISRANALTRGFEDGERIWTIAQQMGENIPGLAEMEAGPASRLKELADEVAQLVQAQAA
ncbi:MAG: hypothetical protein KDD53_06310, partial [Bdellovibrionales bacterium]|nr:hypothetical protein [Bdellovibrionales bacterium]